MTKLKNALTILIMSSALVGCASTQAARLPSMNPDVDQMLKEMAALPSDNKVAVNIKKGIKQIRRQNYAAASKHFSEGLRLNPTNGNLHFLNGLAYHLQSRSGDQAMLEYAESGYALALQYDPDNYWASFFLGHVYFEQQRYVDAQNQFSYALMYEPDRPDFLRSLAVASYYGKELDVGQWAAEKAVQVDPNHPSSWRTASFLRAARGDMKGAQSGLGEYQTLVYQKKSGKKTRALQNWSTHQFSNRLKNWETFHKKNPVLAQVGDDVFGSGAQSEDKPLDLNDDSGDEDDSPASYATPRKPANPNWPKMTLVDVVILRTEESRSQSKGVNLLSGIKATLTGTLFAYNRVSGVASGGGPATQQTRTVAPTLALAGLQYNLDIWNDGINKAEVLARPSLLAVENQPSKFYSGAILHVQLNSNNSDGSLVDVPVGIHLDITPTFIDAETVKIKVHAERNVIEDRDEKLGFTAFSQTAKTSVDATAVLRFGETLILSGLSENEENRSKSGVPLLKNIPGVQYLFSRKTEEETKKSVLILLSPHKARHADEHLTPREARKAMRERRKQKNKHTKALRKKEGIELKNNLDAVFEEMERNKYYREFQKGDVGLDEWHNSDSLIGALKRALGFLWF